MDDLVNKLKSSALGVAEAFTPVLKESKFRETGVLTPQEFVTAGDHLVHMCPTWQWAGGDASHAKPYLPKDKQLLITRNVPCYRRCKQMDYDPEQEKILVEDDNNDEGWVDTHHFTSQASGHQEKVSEMKLGVVSGVEGGDGDTNDDDDGPAMDMEEFAESGMLEEEDPVRRNLLVAPPCAVGGCGEEGVLETRTYDLNITYDKYYQVPRMWLQGYDEKRRNLSVDEMYEDFSAEHAKKTITIENHPNLPGPPMASIHPCRHAEVIKRLMDILIENGKELGVYQYMVVFLKFVQAAIPTVEYDYTRSVTL